MGKMSPETRAKIAAALKGRKKSAEHREKLSASGKIAAEERWQDPAYRAKQRKVQTESHSSDEYRERAAEFGRLTPHPKRGG